MKKLLAVLLIPALAVADVRPVTTNLVVYTDIHSPTGTCHYHARRIGLSIRDGLIVTCQDLGAVDLFNGLTPEQSRAKAAADREKAKARRGGLFGRLPALSNRVECVTH